MNAKRITLPDLISYINQHVHANVKLLEDIEEPKYEKTPFLKTQKVSLLPKNLHNIFNTFDIYVTGTVDVSFFFSLMLLFFPNFNEHKSIICEFIRKLQQQSKAYFDKYNYSQYGWSTVSFCTTLNSLLDEKTVVTPDVIQYVSDYLHINLFILDIQTDTLLFCGSNFIRFKKCAFLLKYPNNNYYEPLTFEPTSSWSKKETDFVTHIVNSPFLVEHINPQITFSVIDKEVFAKPVNKTIPITELKELATKKGLSLTYTNKKGKVCNKTKPMLIKEMNIIKD